MHYNYFYYANRTIHRYPTRQVLVVRQEMLWDDLRTVERYLGGDQHRPFERQGPTITHGSEKFAYRASLDPDLVPHLCCAIPKEIKTYKYLLQRAENLDSQQKLKSFQELSRKCQSPSFEDLVRKCSWSE